MKKLIAVILLTVSVLLSFVSCEKNKIDKTEQLLKHKSEFVINDVLPVEILVKDEYFLYETGATDCGISGITSSSDISTYAYEIEDETHKPTVEIEIDGKTYVANHIGTQAHDFYSDIWRLYTVHNNVLSVFLVYDANYNLIQKNVRYEEETIQKPYGGELTDVKERDKLAYEAFEALADDPLSYLLIENGIKADNFCWQGGYTYTWTRNIGKLKSMEYIIITVDTFGNVIQEKTVYKNTMKNVPTVPDAVVSKVLKTILTDINAKYETVKENFTVQKINDDTAEIRVVRLKDGTVALEVKIGVLVGKNGTSETANETHQYIVPIE